MSEKKYAAVVLSAGKGTRMNSTVPKQYLDLEGKPVLYYSLQAFEQSMADEIVLVTGQDEIEYCRKEIVEKYGFTKVTSVTAGGKERYHSVFCGLKELNQSKKRPDYVMIVQSVYFSSSAHRMRSPRCLQVPRALWACP